AWVGASRPCVFDQPRCDNQLPVALRFDATPCTPVGNAPDAIGLGKICLAGALLVLVCWTANYWWLDAWAGLRFFPKLCELLVAIAFGAMVFFSGAFLLRVSEVQDIVDLLRRRLR